MQYRTLGKTGWDVSVIGFGAWGIGGQWGPVDDATAIDTLKAAYDSGVNFFDTADAYGEPPGRSEALVGRALASVRDKIFIATKVGNWARRFSQPLPFTSPYHVYCCCDASLHRLKTDTIDLYQCHLGSLTEPDIFLEAFARLIEQGKIRAFGISTNALDVARAFNRDGACAAVQLDYSYLNRAPEPELLPYCQENNIGTIIRGPLRMGVCADKFTPDTTFTDSTRQKWNEGEAREKFLRDVATVEKLRFLKTPKRSMAQAALQFVLSHPAVSTAIPGAKSVEQARANAQAGDTVLTDDELQKVRESTAA